MDKLAAVALIENLVAFSLPSDWRLAKLQIWTNPGMEETERKEGKK